jgi:acylphosphatase
MADAIACHLIISGRVQGVAFRWETLRAAERFGVNGWVRNLPDGTVEGFLEGRRQAVEDLIAWCRQGPATAVVTGVEVQDMPYEGRFERFAIRR